MSKIFLVDTENVNFNSIINSRNLNEDDMIVLFLTIFTQKEFQKIKLDALNTKAKIIKIYADTGTKNSLDFQLVSFLGFLLGEHKKEVNNYYIVSRDKGYLSSINLLVNCSNQHIELINSISNIVEDVELDFLLNALVDKFKQQGFTYKTAKKMALLTVSSKHFEDAIGKFNTAFNRNNNIIQSCKYVIGMYFNEVI
mgnify:CR=1 FL=1